MGKIEELLVQKGLYDSVEISINDLDDMKRHLSKSEHTDNTIDCYCTHCNTMSVFVLHNNETHNGSIRINVFDNKERVEFNSFLNKRHVLTYRCSRDSKHYILFDLIATDNKIIKIGQYPSVADLAIPEIEKYKSILKSQYHEFSKAIGLFAHGVGIGSFVYLRRIIENLIFDKYNEVADKVGVKQEDFVCLRFDEKIETIKNYLPSVLVSNKNVYGIVSKGIHELSEKECLEMFPCVRIGIELILDDLLTEKERKEKEKSFEKFVAKKTGELKQ